MSALHPKADICSAITDVALGQKRTPSFDHLGSVREHRRRHRKAKRLGGREMDTQLKLGRRLSGEAGWLLTLKNAIEVTSCAGVLADDIIPVGNKPAGVSEEAIVIDCRQFVPVRQCDD